MIKQNKKNKIISSDLTWEERNSAVYVYYPSDIANLKKIVDAYKLKNNRRYKKTEENSNKRAKHK